MSNKEWKCGYEEGFAAGWKAAKTELNYTNFPPVYYGDYKPGEVATYNFATMNDQTPMSSYYTDTIVQNKKTEPVIRNLTDHTRIV